MRYELLRLFSTLSLYQNGNDHDKWEHKYLGKTMDNESCVFV